MVLTSPPPSHHPHGHEFAFDPEGAALLARHALSLEGVCVSDALLESLRLFAADGEWRGSAAPSLETMETIRFAIRRGVPIDILAMILGSPSPLDDLATFGATLRLAHRRVRHWDGIAEVMARLWRARETYRPRQPDQRRALELAEALRVHGLVSLGRRIPAEAMNEVLEYFRRLPCQAGHVPGMCADPHRRRLADEDAAAFPFGNHDAREVAEAPHLLEHSLDPLILDVGYAYFGCTPKLQHLYAVWSFPGHDDYAVFGHGIEVSSLRRDMSDFNQFWVYTYITDVTERNGPHAYVDGSHRPEVVEAILRESGASTLGGAPLTVADFFDGFGYHIPEAAKEIIFRDRIAPVLGPAGSMFLSNGFNFHCMRRPIDGPRLMLAARFVQTAFSRRLNDDREIPGGMVAERIGDDEGLRTITAPLVNWN